MSSLIKQTTSLTNGYNFPNGGFEEGIKGYRAYKDAVQSSPVDGVDGTALYTSISSSNVNPLLGLNSGIISKSASNAQGEGISVDFTLDSGVLSNNAVISFIYETSANYVTGDISIFLYDITNNIVYTPSNSILSKSIGISEYKANCYFNNTSSKYRLIFHVASSSALAYTIKLDNIQFNEKTEVIGAVIGEWTPYTPTFTGFGTVASIFFQYRRNGSNVDIKGKFTSGTSTAVEARFSLPSGLISRSNVPTIEKVGLYFTNGASASVGTILNEISKDYLTFGFQSGSASGLSKQNGNVLTVNGTIISLEATVPISDWTSNINLITDFQEYAFNTQSTINTNDTTSFGYGAEGTPILSNTATTYYDVQFKNNIKSIDTITLEVKSIVDGTWVNSNLAEVPSLFTTLNRQILWNIAGGLVYPRGMWYAKIGANKIRIYFSNQLLGGLSYADSSTATTRTWANITSAVDGFTHWRVRKISNGNSAEAIPSGIYESGSNANGSYVKYIDGTMKQWGWGYVTCPGGAAYYEATKNLPVAFVGDFDITTSTIGYVSSASPTSRLDFTLSTGALAHSSPLAGGATYKAVARWSTTFGSANYQVGYSWIANGRWNNALQVYAPGALVGITIEESGSNSNGSYIKYSDGTMMCYHKNIANGSTWTFPSAYISPPYGWGNMYDETNIANTGYSFHCSVANPTTTGAIIYNRYNNTTVTNVPGSSNHVFVIGKWK